MSVMNLSLIWKALQTRLITIPFETNAAKKLHLYEGEDDIRDSEPPMRDRAFSLALTSLRKPRSHPSRLLRWHRRQLLLTITYAPMLGPKVDPDGIGWRGILAQDSTVLIDYLCYGGLFGDLENVDTFLFEDYADGVDGDKGPWMTLSFDLEWAESKVILP